MTQWPGLPRDTARTEHLMPQAQLCHVLGELLHGLYSSYKVGKKGLSLWKDLLTGRAETHRSQLCGSMAQAMSAGTSAPCLVCALLQLYCPGSLEDIPSPSSDRKGNSTPWHTLLIKSPSPKILHLCSRTEFPSLFLLFPPSTEATRAHPAAHQPPRVPCRSQVLVSSPPPAREEGLVLCPRLPSQKHTNMCTQGMGNKKQSPALTCAGSRETNPAGFASPSNCPANTPGAPQPCTPENPPGDK